MSYEPYQRTVPAAPFQLTSADFEASGPLPTESYAPEHGKGLSPSLSWSGAPQGTQSFVLTAYDPDAPIPGGLWHWLVKDLPADIDSLQAGAGSEGGVLPGRAVNLTNDLGVPAYSGVQPPPGSGTHRLFLCLTALSVPVLEVPPNASAALVNILMIQHTLGRALLVGTSDPA